MVQAIGLLTSILFFLAASFCSYAQINDAGSKSLQRAAIVADNESAPLKLELSENGRYIKVTNRNETAISKFRFGCLYTRGVSERIVRSFTPKILKLSKVVIQPKNMFSFGTELGGLEKCNSVFESLVVTMVFFEGKQVWKLESPEEN